MKKTYEAPEILFEDFTLSSTIAGNCDVIANHAVNDCGIQWGANVVFSADLVGVCNRTPTQTGGLYDGLCYHNPEENYNLFIS